MDLLAPTDGVVIPPDHKPESRSRDGRLPEWAGSPLDARNQGATLKESDVVCRIGDPQAFAAELIIDQSVVDYIQVGQKVQIKLDAFPHETLTGEIDKIGQDVLQMVPPSLTKTGGGGMETVTDRDGLPRPLNPSYPARVSLQDPQGRFQLGMKGQARIGAEWVPLGSRFYRYLTKTFHFEL
jgi:putative peptide zinc metalloprotease protein